MFLRSTIKSLDLLMLLFEHFKQIINLFFIHNVISEILLYNKDKHI